MDRLMRGAKMARRACIEPHIRAVAPCIHAGMGAARSVLVQP